MSQSNFVSNTSQFCNITDDVKPRSSLMNCCHVLNVDLREVWGFVGLKKTEGSFLLILSSIPFIAFNVFLECLCSEFVEWRGRSMQKCVVMRQLTLKVCLLKSRRAGRFCRVGQAVLTEVVAYTVWNQQFVLPSLFWCSKDCRSSEKEYFSSYLDIPVVH